MKKILEVDMTDKIPPYKQKESDLIFNNRPTRDDVIKAEKDEKLIVMIIESGVEIKIASEQIVFAKGYLKGCGLGIENPSLNLQIYLVEKITDYELFKSTFIKNFLTIAEQPIVVPAGLNRGKL